MRLYSPRHGSNGCLPVLAGVVLAAGLFAGLGISSAAAAPVPAFSGNVWKLTSCMSSTCDMLYRSGSDSWTISSTSSTQLGPAVNCQAGTGYCEHKLSSGKCIKYISTSQIGAGACLGVATRWLLNSLGSGRWDWFNETSGILGNCGISGAPLTAASLGDNLTLSCPQPPPMSGQVWNT